MCLNSFCHSSSVKASARMSGSMLREVRSSRISAGDFWSAGARLFVSFLRFCAKDMWMSQKSFLMSPGIFGFGWTRMRRTAESTFGCGVKAEAGTSQMSSGLPKMWTWSDKTECLPFGARILWATSFWIIRTRRLGGFGFWR